MRSELQQMWRKRLQFTNRTCLRRNTSSKILYGFHWVAKQNEVGPSTGCAVRVTDGDFNELYRTPLELSGRG